MNRKQYEKHLSEKFAHELQPDHEQQQIQELRKALSDLLEFAKQYGPSERASEEDWSGYFEEAERVLNTNQ